jgi:hypothetical protein
MIMSWTRFRCQTIPHKKFVDPVSEREIPHLLYRANLAVSFLFHQHGIRIGKFVRQQTGRDVRNTTRLYAEIGMSIWSFLTHILILFLQRLLQQSTLK